MISQTKYVVARNPEEAKLWTIFRADMTKDDLAAASKWLAFIKDADPDMAGAVIFEIGITVQEYKPIKQPMTGRIPCPTCRQCGGSGKISVGGGCMGYDDEECECVTEVIFCTRAPRHGGPCNGYPREDCG